MAQRTLEQLVEALASLVMMADPHDLQAVNKIMEALEELGEAAEGDLAKFFKPAAAAVNALAEDMIIQSPEEAGQSLEQIGEAVSAFQVALKDGAKRAFAQMPEGLVDGEAAGSDGDTSGSEPAQAVDSGIMEEFLSRQDSFLEEMESHILDLEKNGLKGEPLKKLKRGLHTLKGESGMLGLDDMQRVCHETENYLESKPGKGFGDVLLAVKDWLAKSFEACSAGDYSSAGAEKILKLLGREKSGDGDSVSKKETEAAAREEEEAREKKEKKKEKEKKEKEEKKETPAAEQEPVAEEPAAPCEAKEITVSAEDEPLFWDFVQEARSHLDNADVQLLNLENDPEEPEALNAIFRSFHTIKGVAGFLDLMDVKELSHVAEDALDRARKGRLQLAGSAIDLVFESVDTLRRMVGNVENAITSKQTVASDPTMPSLVANLRRMLEGEEVDFQRPRPQQEIEVEPERKVGEILLDQGKIKAEDLERIIAEKDKDMQVGEALIKSGLVNAQEIADALRAQKSARTAGSAPASAAAHASKVKETVKIDTERLDKLLDAIGELVIAESMVGQNEEILGKVSPEVARNLSHLHKITRVVQELGMTMRMVPIRPTFQKMARLVRDLSRKAGKQVEFVTSGEETELDRSVVERIGDPLIHIIRNSVDHGLEDSADDRQKKGKPRAGRVELRAFHRSGSIYIEVSDDGRGLDRDAILAKARERGLITDGAELSDREIYNLVFQAGFSTAKKITDISGRGVGMDVVRKNVEALRGSIELTSTPGKGTTVSMRLPLTLAIIDGMIIVVGEERYIVPTLSVVESLKPESEHISTVTGRGELLNVRGELIPLYRISRVFGLSGAIEEPTEALAMIVEDQGKRVALMVDNLIGQQQVVIKTLGEGMGHVDGISGGAIMADGRVGLILDIAGIMRITSGSSAAAGEAKANNVA